MLEVNQAWRTYMAERRSGEALLEEISRRRVAFNADQNRMIYDARCELLDGAQRAYTTDLAKFCVALWGYDAEQHRAALSEGTRKLTDVAEQLILFRRPNNRRSFPVRTIHHEYADQEERSSWLLEVATPHGDSYKEDADDDEKTSSVHFPRFAGKLLVKTEREIDGYTEGDDSHLECLWASTGQIFGETQDPSGPFFIVGLRGILASELADRADVAAEIGRQLARRRR